MIEYSTDSAGRNIYPQHVKDDVFALLDSGAKATAVAEQFGLQPRTITKWRHLRRRQASAPGSSVELPSMVLSEDQLEIRRLRQELQRSERREAILKKALSIVNPSE